MQLAIARDQLVPRTTAFRRVSHSTEFSHENGTIIWRTIEALTEMLNVTCPQCKALYHSEETHAGKHLRCSRCGCLVSISTYKERAIVEQSSDPDAVSRQGSTFSTKHRTGRFRSIYVVVVIAIVALPLLLLRLTKPKHGIAKVSDIEETKQSQERPESIDFRPEAGQADDPRPVQYRSLATGTRIEKDIGTDGEGKLSVENGTSEDAVIRLSGDHSLRSFFVKARTSAEVGRIPQGSYEVRFTTGLDWNDSEGAFMWHPLYSEYERTFDYEEQRDLRAVKYETISVTLNPVPFGNVRTKTISREEFLKDGHHIALQ